MSPSGRRSKRNRQLAKTTAKAAPKVTSAAVEPYDLPSESLEELQVYRGEAFSGPLPPPAILADYEKAYPGLAERIVRLAETESQHRHATESTLVGGYVSSKKLGIHAGLAVCLATLICGTVLLALGKPLGGFAALFFALGSPVVAFVTGRAGNARLAKELKDPSADDQEGKEGKSPEGDSPTRPD